MIYEGVVETGLGATSKELVRYHHIAQRVLGYRPFPGSLNVWLHNPVQLNDDPLVVDSKWGEYYFWPAKINQANGHLMRPPLGRNRPRDAEMVAPVSLRSVYGLKDGDEVRITIL